MSEYVPFDNGKSVRRRIKGFDAYFYANLDKTKTMKDCKECGKPADAPIEQQTESYPICKECMDKGWITDSKEVVSAIANDPELSKGVGIISPIQPL